MKNYLKTPFVFIAIRLFLFGLFSFFSFSSLGQSEENEQEVVTSFDDAPLYIIGGAQLGQYYGPEYRQRFDFRLGSEFGFWFQYSLFQQFPFYSGLEWQWRGYDIDSRKTGTNQSGYDFVQTAKGQVDLHYLMVPFLFQIPAGKPNQKLHLIAGLNTSFRFLYKDRFCADFQIPAIGFQFDSCYSKFRNDAMDYIDFHGVAGLVYRAHPRISILFIGSYKLAGVSTSKENFITRRELNTHFSLKLLFKIGRLGNLPFI